MSAKAHVLIVEDEPVTRAKLAAYLTSEGFQVSEAADARDRVAGLESEIEKLRLELEAARSAAEPRTISASARSAASGGSKPYSSR